MQSRRRRATHSEAWQAEEFRPTPGSEPVTIQVPLPVLGVVNGVRDAFMAFVSRLGCRSWRP